MEIFWSLLVTAPFFGLSLAVPAPQGLTNPLAPVFPNLTTTLDELSSSIDNALQARDPSAVITALLTADNLVTVTPPSSPEQARDRLQSIQSSNPPTLYQYVANLRALNLVDSIDSLLNYAQNFPGPENSDRNSNPAPPSTIYPKKLSCDAMYTMPEDVLRSAIYIPPGFSYGRKPPVILFPGTASNGYTTFKGNLIPLLTGSDWADPVWVNVPGLLLDDAQTNAEFAAYAINYVSSVTQMNVTMVGWSQGNIDTQWAFKFWPSTRLVASNHVAVSPDYAGTIFGNFLTPPGIPMAPSLLQQRYLESSNFITTLRAFDGDSGYVSTTTVYSGFFDEIVQPQSGTGASAFLRDARDVGVTNYEVQQVCAGQPAGTFYGHAGVLYNPLTVALLRDVMANSGPGRVERLDLANLCSQYLAPGLNVADLLITANSIAIAALAILAYIPRTFVEPAIMQYAQQPPISDLAVCQGSATTTTTTSVTTPSISTSVTSPIFTTTTTSTSTSSSGSSTTTTTPISTTTTTSSVSSSITTSTTKSTSTTDVPTTTTTTTTTTTAKTTSNTPSTTITSSSTFTPTTSLTTTATTPTTTTTSLTTTATTPTTTTTSLTTTATTPTTTTTSLTTTATTPTTTTTSLTTTATTPTTTQSGTTTIPSSTLTTTTTTISSFTMTTATSTSSTTLSTSSSTPTMSTTTSRKTTSVPGNPPHPPPTSSSTAKTSTTTKIPTSPTSSSSSSSWENWDQWTTTSTYTQLTSQSSLSSLSSSTTSYTAVPPGQTTTRSSLMTSITSSAGSPPQTSASMSTTTSRASQTSSGVIPTFTGSASSLLARHDRSLLHTLITIMAMMIL